MIADHPGATAHRPRPAVPSTPAAPLGTPRGRAGILATQVLTVLAQVALAGVLIQLGRLVAGPASAADLAWALGWALMAVATTAAATWLPEASARAEEAPLRSRLLRAWWQSPTSAEPTAAGRTVGLLTDSVARVAFYRQSFLGTMAGAVAAPLAVLVVTAITVDPVSAGILAVAMPVIPLAIRGFQAAVRSTSTASREARAKLAGRYLEAIQGLETLAMLGAAPRVAADLADVGEENRRATMRLLAGNQLILLVTDAVFSLAIVTTTAALASWRLGAGAITPGAAVGLVLCSILLIGPLDLVGQFFYVGMSGGAAQRAIRRFLGAEVAPAPVVASASEGGPLIDVCGATLGYGDRAVLTGLDLRVAAGERLVLLGPSGGGKSTLLAALKGDLVPRSGTITVASIPLTAASRDAVRAASALVAQSTWLFTGTLADNLRIGNPDVDDAALWAALDAVALDDFVAAAPLGLDTPVGERGLAISGGQAQRLSLARALLSGRRLLLLDEPTAHVDLASERIILDALDALGPEYSVVLITHRASASLVGARTLRLAQGCLAEDAPEPAGPALAECDPSAGAPTSTDSEEGEHACS